MSIFALWIMLQIVIVLAGFILNYFHAANAADKSTPNIRHYKQAALWEIASSFLIVLTYPFGWLQQFRHRQYRKHDGPPIVLITDHLLNSAAFLLMKWRLRRTGYQNVYVVNLEPSFGSIDTMAHRLAQELADIYAATAETPLNVVAHGAGGVALRYALQSERSFKLGTSIHLGSPHLGSLTAVFGFGQISQQLRVNSSFLAKLGSDIGKPNLALYSNVDNVTMPTGSAAFGLINREIRGHGHLQLLFSHIVYEHIIGSLPPVIDTVPASGQETQTMDPESIQP